LLHSGSVLVWLQLAVPSVGVGGFAQSTTVQPRASAAAKLLLWLWL
jgi:hypothetical protein